MIFKSVYLNTFRKAEKIIMQCPNCNTRYTAGEERLCRRCGTELKNSSTSIVPLQRNMPAKLYQSPVPRTVAASVGALAVGIGFELLRRNVLGRFLPALRTQPISDLLDLKDVLSPQHQKTTKLPKGVEVHESVVYVRRVIRRTR